jgi:bifunctional DNA-binding transcriptional regulator/antitoxin component of YhaV-PrlF toxin-antitoxin module
MYNNNIVRKLDNHGRLVIPANIRQVYELDNCKVEVFSENDLICIRKTNDKENQTPKSRKFSKGTSGCNFCICSSCTGWNCPWVRESCRYGWTIGTLSPERCKICMSKDIGLIHDCDFYTRRKRMKFYFKKKVKIKTKHEIVMQELSELKKLLDKR